MQTEYKVKNGEMSKRKGLLVVRGNQQKEEHLLLITQHPKECTF
jgi:hypothetical protein